MEVRQRKMLLPAATAMLLLLSLLLLPEGAVAKKGKKKIKAGNWFVMKQVGDVFFLSTLSSGQFS